MMVSSRTAAVLPFLVLALMVSCQDAEESDRAADLTDIRSIKAGNLPPEEKGKKLIPLLAEMSRKDIEERLGSPDAVFGDGRGYWSLVYDSYRLVVDVDPNGNVAHVAPLSQYTVKPKLHGKLYNRPSTTAPFRGVPGV